MTNSQIIYNAALAHGFTEDQLSQLMDVYGELPFHTFQEWKARGYSVKKGEHALFTADLWKFTNKTSKAAAAILEAAGKEIPAENPHYYKKLSHLFSFSQVERSKAPAKKAAKK